METRSSPKISSMLAVSAWHGEFMGLDIPLKQELLESVPELLSELDLHIVEDVYMSKAMGNSYVTLQSPGLTVRFVRDRGQVWAEVAAVTAPTNWLHVGFVLEAIHGQQPRIPFDLTSAVGLLRDNFGDLVQALGPKLQETRREMEKRGAERLKALIASSKNVTDP